MDHSPGKIAEKGHSVETERERIAGLDAFRLVAAFFVILLHVGDFGGSLNGFIVVELRYAGGWAVPFFFMITGYFGAYYLQNSAEKIARQAAKVLWVFVFSCLIFLPLTVVEYGPVEAFNRALSLDMVTRGTYYHLWFLSAMFLGLFVFYTLRVLNLRKITPLLVILIVGILIFDAYFPRYRPFADLTRYLQCFPFIYLGFIYRWKSWNLNLFSSVMLMVLGFVLMNLEALFLYMVFEKPPHVYGFLIGLVPFSVGIFALAWRLPDSRLTRTCAKYGVAYSLGIYVFHPYIIYFLDRYIITHSLAYGMIKVPLIFFLTLITLKVIEKFIPGFLMLLKGNSRAIERIDCFSPAPPGWPKETDKRS